MLDLALNFLCRVRGHLSSYLRPNVFDNPGGTLLSRTKLATVNANHNAMSPAMNKLCHQRCLRVLISVRLPYYLTTKKKRPACLRADRLMGEHGLGRGSARSRRRVRSDHIYFEALGASQMSLKIRPRSQSAQPPLRARMNADGVCETRIRSVGRGSGSSRGPTAVGHVARSQGRGAGVGRGRGTGAHLPLHGR